MKEKSIDFLDLGNQPLANSNLTKKNLSKEEKKYRLIICFNKENKLVYIKKTFSSKEMFTDKYPYRSSASKTMTAHLKKLEKNLKKKKIQKNTRNW